MTRSVPDSSLIRQFLLGRLNENEELENKVSEGIVFDDDVSEMADAIEDEIIEEYLDGRLDSGDKTAVDEYFLRPGDRRRKLRFIRLLQHHFEKMQDDLSPSRPTALFAGARYSKDSADLGRSGYWRSHYAIYTAFAALALLCILSLSYLSSLRDRQIRLESDLVRERERSADLAAELSQLQPSLISLTLMADRSRDTGVHVPRISIKPSTQRIIVEIVLPKGEVASCDVRLERKSAKTPIWAARLLPILSPSGDARLVFEIPTQGLQSEIYWFVVSPASAPAGWEKYYDFEAKVAK